MSLDPVRDVVAQLVERSKYDFALHTAHLCVSPGNCMLRWILLVLETEEVEEKEVKFGSCIESMAESPCMPMEVEHYQIRSFRALCHVQQKKALMN